ncbi:hypothetical protein Tco_1433867, partial [Tanacetum coccineum]
EGRMELIKELTKRVLALEEAKTAQDRVINRLKLRVKRLEKKRKARTPQPIKRRLFKGIVKTSTDTSLGEDASKQAITTTGPSHVSTADQVGTARPETLIKMKEVKAKEKGVEFRNVEKATRPVRSITTLQPLPKIDPKTKSLIIFKPALILMLCLLQSSNRKREQFTIEERAQFLVKTIAAQRKFRATQRDVEIKSKPPTKTQQQKRIQDFIPMDSEKEAQKSEEEATKYEKDKDELRLSLKINFGDDSEVNYEPLSRRFPIMNWEYNLLGNVDAKDMYVYKLTRVDGSSSYHGDMQAFLRRLDRQDLNDLYRLVQERFQDHPLKGHVLLLWGDLRMLFDLDEKDKLWMNQLD